MPTAPFIGRAAQLAEIAEVWAARRPGIILITGEAGSGKSRLVAEALDRLDRAAATVLRGAARSLGAAPHDWLASVLSGHPAVGLPVEESLLNRLAQRTADGTPAAAAGPRLAPATTLRAAVDVVRALLRAAPAPTAGTVATATPGGGPGDEATESGSHPVRLFTRSRAAEPDGGADPARGGADPARDAPGIIVVEDLHDLDPASLALVAELAAVAETLPALLLVTSRPPQEAVFAPAAARTLRRLGGGPSVLRLHVAPFTARETAELIEAVYGSAPAPEAVRGALRRTGGNPFWLTELLAAYDTAEDLSAAPLPAHVVGLLVEPLADEPALVGRVARAAALLGDPVEHDVLFHVCGGDVEPALRRLLDLGMLLIAPDLAPAGSLRFRHPLLREALAAGAVPRERTRVHTLARGLAVELGDDAALARHAAALGRTAEARAAAARGAAASLAGGLPEAALDLVALGLSLQPRPAPAPEDVPGQRRALAAVGAAAGFVGGRFGLAAEHAADWLNEAQRRDDADETADAHRQLAAVRWCLGDQDGHRRSLDRAAAVGGSAASLARQRTAEAESALRLEDAATALPLAEAALAAAQRAGAGIGSASVTLGTALALTGAFERGVAMLRAARQLAVREQDPVTIGRAVHNLVAISLPRLGEVTGWRLFDEAMATIARYGLEFCAGRTTSLGVAHAVRAGDLARAEALVWSRLPIEGDPVELVRFTARAGLLALERGDDPLAVRMLARADAEDRDSGLVRVLRVAVAARGVHPVDPAEALRDCVGRCSPALLAEAARWALHGGVPVAVVEEHVAEPPPRLLLLLAVAAGRDPEAVALLPAALGLGTIDAAPGVAASRHGGTAQGFGGTADRPAGRRGGSRAARRRAGYEDGARAGTGPAGGDSGGRAEEAAVHTAVAHALSRLGRAGEARRHAERAVALLAHWPGWRHAEAETLLHSLRAGGDLTARELEVLGCLAAGMTNQQVASSLGISIRTVTVHVSNLLRKTGAASRTEAALWAVRHRLAPGR
ncbi:LuxR C-terminal-related transcriptional regulator [Dactylosporangium sp. NPDC051484]|uniref:helix-turn-helix transcriptional regulator n=1 Tax=Dactylosporangium sp. NPDC051484 TaxID=3154942 RepID=UPI00344F541B